MIGLLAFPLAIRAALGPNLALHQPVEASGEVWASLSPISLTDGDPGTFCHPLASTGTRDFFFEVDLGRTYRLEEIRIRNRADGCCPERLTRYRVEVYADAGGETGALQWSAEIRGEGSHSGVSGVDAITGQADSGGNFAGRFVRVVNASGLAYSPQLAEVEVYGGVPPSISLFEAERDVLAAGESTELRWAFENGTGGWIDPGGIGIGPSGMIEVQPAGTTEYVLTATNAAGTALARVRVGVDVVLDPPIITEFLAENERGLKDEDRDASDWIELWNPNLFSLNLEGFVLTDEAARLAKWRLPNRKIPPGGRIVIFASGKDRPDPAGELHTNFRLAAEGEYLALVRPDGVAAQQFPRYPRQMKDVSYGTGTNGVAGFMRPPTPGEENGFAFAGAVADTKFKPDRGFYTNKIWVTIETETPGAVIRYSTDGTEPSATRGRIYTGPVEVERTTVLRAAAFRTDWSPTDVDTHSYLFLSDVITSSVMRTTITRNPAYAPLLEPGLRDLPTISLTSGQSINGTAETRSSMEWLPAGQGEAVQENCGARLFGGAFTTFAKKNFRLYFRARHGAPELRAGLFETRDGEIAPVEEFDQLELRGGSHDMEQRGFYMSNIFADDTLLAMKQLNPHGRFIHLYLNGAYWGVFHLRERWNADMHQSYLGGSRTNYESINGNWNVGGWAEPGTAYDGDGSTWERVKQLRGDYEAVRTLLDVEQYVDFMIAWMFGGAEDEYRAVGPAGQGSGFKLYLNDADGWFCGPWYCAANNRTARSSPGRKNGDGPGSIFSMLFQEAHPDYRTLLADRIHKALILDGTLTPARNVARLDRRMAEIDRAFLAEAARWNYLNPEQWRARRAYAVTDWLPRRTTEVLADFRAAGLYPALGAPILNKQGGSVAAGFQVQFATPRDDEGLAPRRVLDPDRHVHLGFLHQPFADDAGLHLGAVAPRKRAVVDAEGDRDGRRVDRLGGKRGVDLGRAERVGHGRLRHARECHDVARLRLVHGGLAEAAEGEDLGDAELFDPLVRT